MEPVLKTKVVPPQRRVGLLRRPRLVDFLHENIHRRLILISAGPGYGKTSLLLDFLQDTDLTTCWYAMDPSDADPWVFVSHLVASHLQAFPELADGPLGTIGTSLPADTTPRQILQQLVNQVQESVSDYFAILIDDFQFVDGSDPVRKLATWFLEHIPDNCGLVLATRTMPELPYVKLAAREEIAGLGSQDLAFTADEIQAYLRLNHNVDLPPEEAQALASESEGWITAILLGTHTLWKGLLHTILAARGKDAQVFDYLAQEVFDGQPEPARRFLKATSVLQVLRPAFCDALLGIESSATFLEDFERRNLFVSRLAGEARAYRYHALFQDFLERQFQPEELDEKRALLRSAGALTEQAGDLEGALTYCLTAGDRREAARLVRTMMEAAYQSGRLVTVASWLEALGTEVVNSDPELVVMRGRLHRHAGEFDQALEQFALAVAMYSERGERAKWAGARVRQAQVYRYRGEVAAARQICDEVLAQAEAVGLDASSQALAHRILGEVHHEAGQPEEAKRALRRALEMYERGGNRHQVVALLEALGNSARRMGNPLEAEGHFRKALRIGETLGNRWRLAEIKNNIGVGYYYQGEYAKADETLQEALAEARTSGHTRTEGLVLVSLGDLYLDLGQLRRAQDCYQTGLDCLRSAGDTFLEVYVLCAKAQLYRMDEAWEHAHSILEEAVRAAGATPTDFSLGLISLTRGAVLLAQGDTSRAAGDLEMAVARLGSAGARRELARSRLWLGFAHHRAGDAAAAARWVGEAVDLSAEIAHPHLLVPDGRWMAPMLEEVRTVDPGHRAALDALLTRIHQFVLALPSGEGEKPTHTLAPPRLEVCALGEPSVKVDGHAVPHAAWGGPLVRELFFYLLENQPARREIILDTFWPDYTTAKAKEVFHATVYRMRRVLPRGTIAFDPDQENYSVVRSSDFWYDASTFEQLIRRSRLGGPEASTLLEQALSVYRGSFLPGVDSEWAGPRREALRSAWVDGLARMAQVYESRGDGHAAVEALRRAVREEPYREDLHRGLMEVLSRVGRPAEAVAHYRELTELLMKDLGVGPAPETESLYRGILRAMN